LDKVTNRIVELLDGIRRTLHRDLPLVTEKVVAEDPRRMARHLDETVGVFTDVERKAGQSVVEGESESRPLGHSATGASPIRRVSGLGDKVDALVARSPTISRHLDDVLDKGFRIEVGPKGGGSHTNIAEKKITIDGGEARKPKEAVTALAHELGHVRTGVYKPQTFHYWNTGHDQVGMARYHDEWANKNVKEHLRHEADAIFTEVHGIREIATNGGPRIRLHSGREVYEMIYDKVAEGTLPKDEALDAISVLAGMETIPGGPTRTQLYRANIHDILSRWREGGDNI
jgi:hypothetical protein